MSEQHGICAKCRKRKDMAVIAVGKSGGGVCHKCFQKEVGMMQNDKVNLPWRGWKIGFEEWLRVEKQNGRFKNYDKNKAYSVLES